MMPDRGMAEDVPFREGPQGRREPHPMPFFLLCLALLLSHGHSAAYPSRWEDSQPSPFRSLVVTFHPLPALGNQLSGDTGWA